MRATAQGARTYYLLLVSYYLLLTTCYLLLATCYSPLTYHLQERFLHAQMPLLLDALRPLCWSTVSVEASLQCVSRPLHG